MTEAAAVQEGVAFLNERDPGWRSRVDVDELELATCDRCVMAQLYGSYSEGRRRYAMSEVAAQRHGFDVPPPDLTIPGADVLDSLRRSYARLQAAWETELTTEGKIP